MKKIDISTPTYPNTFALVDDEDHERLNRQKWFAMETGPQTTIYVGRRLRILMHREVLCLCKGDGKMVDHRDGNGLNNQKSNLRICTKSQNAQNSRLKVGFSSKYKGVSRKKNTKKWLATIVKDRKQKWIGLFDTEIEAAKAYDRVANELFGEFARTNF